jgi:hypothetical protein
VPIFDGLLAPKPLLPAALVPVLPVAPELLDPALLPPLDCAWAIAAANITLANKPIPYVAFFIVNSLCLCGLNEITARLVLQLHDTRADSLASERALSPCL